MDWRCHTSADISNYISTYLAVEDYFKAELFIVDTVVSPQNDIYIKKVLEDEIFLSFAQASGTRGIVKMGHYNVTTDNSIWPFDDTSIETGHYITSFRSYTIELSSTHYVKV